MPILHLIILALVQGITEFLPISSSGHLVLVHEFIGDMNHQQNLLMDVAVHVGTLFSILLYFRADICKMLCGLKDTVSGKQKSENAKLNYYIILSSLPVIAAGFALYHFQVFAMRSVEVIAWTTLIFGILLWAVDAYKPQTRTLPDINWQRAVFIGFAQALALIPGTSRSGITMTAARFLGFTRTEAARYSLLLAVIAISGAGLIGTLSVIEIGALDFTLDIALAAILAFVSGYIAISLMMKWLAKASFAIFALYRIGLGLILMLWVYTNVLNGIL